MRPGAALLTAVGVLAGGCDLAPREPELSESARWLQRYLRLDTSNPPGDEGAAVAYLAGLLAEAGIASEVLTTPAGRASLYASLGPPDGETLLLLHHVDVVPPGEGWTVDPFAGVVRDGALWGRGAIDAKGLGIAHLAAFVDLARGGGPLARRVAFLASADEEAGGGEGVGWWLVHRPDLLGPLAGVVTEGGSNRAAGGRVAWWGIEVAQKQPLWLEACAEDPALLVRALARLVDRPPVWRVTEPARAFFGALAAIQRRRGGRGWDPDEVIRPSGPVGSAMPGMQNFFLDSLQVNTLELEGERACATIDARLLPDADPAAFLAGVVADLGAEVATRQLLAGPPWAASPTDHPLYRLLAAELSPTAVVVPTFISGITDARYFRARGIPAYGFSPFLLDGEHTRTVHGADERIPLAELEAGVERLTRVARAWALGVTGAGSLRSTPSPSSP